MRRRAGSRLDVAKLTEDLMLAEQMLDLMRRLRCRKNGREFKNQSRRVADVRAKLADAQVGGT